MIDTNEVLDAVLSVYQRLHPYGEAADPRLRGSTYDDNARLSAATRIVQAAIDHARQAAPIDPDALDQIETDLERSA